MSYCVYLTVYKGNKLPRRYIGSTSVDKIKSGYNGTIQSRRWKSIYKEEQKNNKHLFKTRILQIFETRTEAFEAELILQLKYNVVNNDLYMNLSYAIKNGYFGSSGENNPMYGKTHTPEAKKRMSECRTGTKASVETKKKMSIAHSRENLSEDTIEKMSNARSGIKNPMYGKYGTDHPASGRTVSEEERIKISNRMKGVPKTQESISKRLKKTLKKFIVYDNRGFVTIVSNAKEYCNGCGYNYSKFITVAKHNLIWSPNNAKYNITIKLSEINYEHN